MLSAEMLSDRAEIGDIVAGLAHGQSDRDVEALRALFAEEVALDMSKGDGSMRIGADDLVQRMRAALAGFDTVLYSTSDTVTTVDGDSARARVTVHAYYHLSTEQGVCNYSLGRNAWDLALARVDGRWMIVGWTLGPVAPIEGYPGLSELAHARSAAAH